MDPTQQGRGHAPLSLDDLVFRFLEDSEAGDAPPSDVLDGLCAEHPAWSSRLRAAVERLSGTGLGRTLHGPGSGSQSVGGYRLMEQLGAGGMGVVYRAQREDGAGEEVALKLLHPHERNEPAAQERFAREARAIASLDHPAIVKIAEFGEVRYGDVPTPFLAMAYHRGATLDRFLASADPGAVKTPDASELGAQLHRAVEPGVDPLERSSSFRGPWWRVVAAIGCDLASGLAHAHERGVVHRDVKPSNVLATPDGRVLLLDFGLAWTTGSGRITRSGAQLGSLPYLAPERVTGRTAGPSADTYALGLVLYELLTLQPAFAGSDRATLGMAVEQGRSLRPSRVAPWIPAHVGRSLDALVERATARDPRDRYPSMRALSLDLQALVRGDAIQATPVSSATRALRAVRRQPWRAATAALVVLGAVGYFAFERRIAAGARADARNELASIEERIESLGAGFVKISTGPLAQHPRFAPSALPALLEERERMLELKARLAGLDARTVDVRPVARRADEVLSDLLIEIANARMAVGRKAEAVGTYRERIEHLERMVKAYAPDGSVARAGAGSTLNGELGRSYGMLARGLQMLDPTETGLAEARRGVALFDGAYRADESDELTSSQLVSSLLILAEALHRSYLDDEARAALDRAEETSVREFGPTPAQLQLRGQRAEMEMQRYGYGLIDGGRPAEIAALTRAVEWFDGSSEPLESAAVHATMRLAAGRSLAMELRHAGRLEAALERIEEALELCAHLSAQRGGTAAPNDPIAREHAALLAAEAMLRADLGGSAEQADAIAALWSQHEAARAQFIAEPSDNGALLQFVQTAGNYANQAVFQPDAEPWQIQRSIEATDAALEAADGAPAPSPRLRATVLHCVYARGLALARAGEVARTYRAVERLEQMARRADAAVADPHGLRMAADLCSELYGRAPEGPGSAGLRRRTLDLLEAAVAAGYSDVDELRGTEALHPFRGDPRFASVLAAATAHRAVE